jgi:hypothetical protein
MKLEVTLWIVVLTLFALAYLFPKTKWLSLSAIVVAIIAVVSLVFVAERGAPTTAGPTPPPVVRQMPVDFERFHVEKLDKVDPEAKSRIRVEELRFDQIRPEAGAERGSIGEVVARLYNNSATYTLTDYGYYLVVQDCVKSVCTTVFDQHGLSAISVPPNQARDVRVSIRDEGMRATPPIKILGTVNILLTPTETRAQPASSTVSTDPQ